MGLDQYLEKSHYIGANYEHRAVQLEITCIEQVGSQYEKTLNIDVSKVSEIIESVGYWRKANAIHQWFEYNTSFEGNSDRAYVGQDTLAELRDTCLFIIQECNLVDGIVQNGSSSKGDGQGLQPNFEAGETLEDAHLAMMELPTTSGFFFGSTDYDQWYMADVEDTYEMLTEILEDYDGSASYYYTANW